MSSHSYLCVATVGPIQTFIEAARRTRDLWSGSTLLSNISRSVALCLKECGGRLIFPHPESVEHGSSVVNIVWASFRDTDEDAVRSYLEAARQSGNDTFLKAAQSAHEEVRGLIHEERWMEQIEDPVLEYYAACLPVPSEDQYADVRLRLTRVLAARKASHDFQSWAGQAGVPKSSLDGARESVWDPGALAQMSKRVAGKLRLNPGEQLDAVGVTKRVGLRARQFPSVSRIAADAWIRGLEPTDRGALASICSKLKDLGLIFYPETFPQFVEFPYEGSAVYERRHDEILEVGDAGQLEPLKKQLSVLTKRYGEPGPYVAVLAADGDGMGKAITNIHRENDHRDFSKQLSGFADAAKRIVERWHGALVYSGGDDVLAILPPDTALECARELREQFCKDLLKWGPTLSVGIGIGHSIGEDLEDLLCSARAAEREAKQGEKNQLSIHWAARRAEPVCVTFSWSTDAPRHLHELTRIFMDDALPDGAVYQLREMARHYIDWKDHPEVGNALRADALRLLGRKAARSKPAAYEMIQASLRGFHTGEDLARMAKELVVARRFAAVYRQSGRKPGEPIQ